MISKLSNTIPTIGRTPTPVFTDICLFKLFSLEIFSCSMMKLFDDKMLCAGTKGILKNKKCVSFRIFFQTNNNNQGEKGLVKRNQT